MKKIFILVLLCLCATYWSFAIPFVETFKMDKTSIFQILKLKSFNDKVFALINYSDGKNSVDYFDGKDWKNITNTDKGISPGDFAIDSKGNIWIISSGTLWNYNWTNWNSYKIIDSLSPYRQFLRICADNSGAIYLASIAVKSRTNGTIIIVDTISTHEIYRFDGAEFLRIDSIISIRNINGFGLDNGFEFVSGNRLVAHFPGRDVNDLFIYENNKRKSVTTLHGPYFDKMNSFKMISRISEDSNNNLWFTLGGNSDFFDVNGQIDLGITILNKDNSWKTIDTANGWFHSQISFYSDPGYLFCNDIGQSSDGKTWVVGKIWGYFDENRKFHYPESDIADYCTVYGYANFYNSSDSNRRHYLELLSDFNYSGPNKWSMLNANCIAAMDDGSIWFGMYGLGLLHYKPNVESVEQINSSNISPMLSPNPVSEYLTINTNQEIEKIEIFSVFGLKCREQACLSPTERKEKIDVSGLPSGVYFVRIGDKVSKFIKI